MKSSTLLSACLATMLLTDVCFADVDIPIPSLQPGEVSVGAAVSPLKKQQPAPFTGVLLSPEAVAKVIVDYNNQKAQAEIEATKARETQKATDQLVIDNLKADIQHEKAIAAASAKEKSAQLEILTKQIAKAEKEKPNTTLWAALGAGAGAVLATLCIVVASLVK